MSPDVRTRIFERIFDTTSDIFDRLPIPREPQLMRYLSEVLEPAVTAARPDAIAAYDAVLAMNAGAEEDAAGADSDAAADRAVGLNTVGLLCDRLSILTIKYWKLKHHYGKPEAAAELAGTQVREMIAALAEAQRGFSSINNKVTNRDVSAKASSFTEAFYGLQTVNLLIWESQEVLYTRDISVVAADELRAYVAYFSLQNLTRNVFIDLADTLFWRCVDGAPRRSS
jgi:hypothetical protein